MYLMRTTGSSSRLSSLQHVRFLAEAEQVRIYGRFKLFLDGLGFPLKFISLVEAADPERDPALVAQRQVLSELAATPQLQKLQQESLRHQQGSLQHCTTTRHFVVVSASTSELARLRADGTERSPLLRLSPSLAEERPAIIAEQVKNELRIRVSIVKKTSSNSMFMQRSLTTQQHLKPMHPALPLARIFPPLRLRFSMRRNGGTTLWNPSGTAC